MGILRLFLALAVVAGHSSRILGVPLVSGRTAVECFFAISGFYMAMVLERKYLRLPSKRWLTFMGSRVMRLFPVYLLVLALSLLLVLAGGRIFVGSMPQTVNQIFTLPPVTAIALAISNVLLFSQDWSLFAAINPDGMLYATSNFQQQNTPAYLYFLIPQAWTVGVELTFYLVAPFLLRLRTSGLIAVAAASLAARGVFALLGLTSDPWTYRFFPFELSIFLAGAIAYRQRERLERFGQRWKYIPLVAVLLLLESLLVTAHFPAVNGYLLVVVPFVFAAAIPAVFRSTRHSRVDRWLGELSYPLYLVHVLVISTLVKVGIASAGPGVPGIVAATAAIAVTVVIVQLIDRPLEAFRQRRIKRTLEAAGLSSASRDSGVAPSSLQR